MEISDYLKMTPEQRERRKKKWEKRKEQIAQEIDPDKATKDDRATKALFLLEKDLENDKNTLDDDGRETLSAIVVERCMDDFFFFAKYILKFDLLTEQTHKRWADDLQSSIKNNKKRVMRLKPRGTYKCLEKGTELLSYGIDDNYNLDRVKLLNQGDFIEKGIKVTTASGRSYICTKDHKFKTIDGWDSPKLKLRIAMMRKIPNPYKPILESEEYLVGLLVGDGCLRKSTPRLSSGDDEIIVKLKEYGFCINKIGNSKYDYSILNFYKEIKECGLKGTTSWDKFIPKKYEGSKHFLRGIFDADGSVSKSQAIITYTTVSEKLANDVMRNLLYFGIVARKKYYEYKKTDKSPEVKCFVINIYSRFLNDFNENIGFICEKKQRRLDYWIGECNRTNDNPNCDTIPNEWRKLLKKDEKRILRYDAKLRIDNHYAHSRNKVVKCGKYLKNKDVISLSEADIFWDEIIKIEDAGKRTFSAIGSSSENYITPDGMIHHNSTLYGIGLILWIWGCIDTKIRIFYTSANALLLNEVSDSIDRFLGSSKGDTLFSSIFNINKDEKAKNTSDVFNIEGRSGKGFSLILRTAGGSTVGIHPNVIISDDALDQNDRESQATRDQKVRWFDSLSPLLVPFFCVKRDITLETIFYIGTRWHMKDLCYHIFETNKKLPQSLKWDIEVESIYNKEGTTNYPEFMTDEKIAGIKSSISDIFFSCNPGEAPVLMKDFTTKQIKDIKVGDKIIGFTHGEGLKNKSKLVVTEVLQTKSRRSDVVKVTLESGRVIRCTPDHKWYNGRSNKDSHSTYTPAKVGRNLLRVVDCHYTPSFDDLLNWRWLGGMFDGEGSLKQSQLSLHQSKEKNPGVFKKIISVLDELKLSYNLYCYKGKDGCYQFHLRGGRDTRAHLIRYGNCGKKQQILDGILKIRNRTVSSGTKHHNPQIVTSGGRDKVIKIEPDGNEMVYSMQTTTGNYVVWGYASKNCQYVNNPLAEGMQTFDISRLSFVRMEQVDLTRGQLLCVFDPSKGKTSNDYPAVWWVHRYEDEITFIDAIDEKIQISLMVHRIAAINKKYSCRTLLFEDNNAFLLEDALIKSHAAINWHINIETVHHGSNTNKHERIISIQPELYSGHTRFIDDYEERYPEAMNQIIFYPVYGNDDFPDAAQMAIEYFNQPHFTFERHEEIL